MNNEWKGFRGTVLLARMGLAAGCVVAGLHATAEEMPADHRQDSPMVTISPAAYPGALRNPLKGFRPDLGKHAFEHEYVTLVRHYIPWNELENVESDTIEKIEAFCNEKWAELDEKGIRVIPRVYLDWDHRAGNENWPADMVDGDYSSEQFVKRVRRLIDRLGQAWDNDPRVAWVQMGIIGYWGEHHSPSPGAEMQTILGEAFSAAFTNKAVLVRHAHEFTDYQVGYYWDSWAHINQIYDPRQGAGIDAANRRSGRWKHCPIEGETAYNWGDNKIQPGDDPDDTLSDPEHLEFLIDSIRKLHCSALGWVSNYDARKPAVANGAQAVQKAFGYRFVIPEISWSRRAEPSGALRLEFEVINTGSAPFYRNWPVEFSLLDRYTGEVVWKTTLDHVDIREWLPGDEWDEENNRYSVPAKANRVDALIPLPGEVELPSGIYVAALAVLDPAGNQPALRFAIRNYHNSGRHPIGRIGIGENVAGSHELDPAKFDDPMQR